ncbi:MAG: FecR domain-containing protein [Chloroflexi bacterium]|nr:FecR domain-containing protein [Chloroflexota bacterium]
MLKHDAICRALGAAWVAIFVVSLLLPLGTPTSAQTADSPGLPSAQATEPSTTDELAASPAEPPIRLSQLSAAGDLAADEVASQGTPPTTPAPAPSSRAATATLEVRQGQVEVSPPGSTEWGPAQTDTPLAEGTRVRTLSSGSARIVYSDGSRSELSPNTGVVLWMLQQTDSGQPVVRLVQASGTTLHRVRPLTDAAARFEVETVAGTASVRGTDLGISERRTSPDAPKEFLFQNVSTPAGGDPVEVTADASVLGAEGAAAAATPCPTPAPLPPGAQPPAGAPTPCPPAAAQAVGNLRVTILGGQEVLATQGRGLGPVMGLGRNAQIAQTTQSQVSNRAGAQQAAQLAQQMLPRAAQGAFQSLPLGGPPVPPPLLGAPPVGFFGGGTVAPGFVPPFVPPVVPPAPTFTPVVLCATITPVPGTATSTPTRTNTPVPTATSTGTVTPTLTPSPTLTPTTTPSPTPTFPPFVTGSPAPLCTPGPGTVIPLPTTTATPTRTATATPLLFGPTDVQVTHDRDGDQLGGGNDRVFVALRNANQVTFIDPNVLGPGGQPGNRYATVSLPAGSLPEGLAFSREVRGAGVLAVVFTANTGAGTVSMITNATSITPSVVQTINLSDNNQPAVLAPGATTVQTGVPVPVDLVAHTYGDPVTRVFVTDRGRDQIHIIDVAPLGPSGTLNMTFVGRIQLPPGADPEGIDVCVGCGGTAGVDLVFWANRGLNTVSFFNVLNPATISTIGAVGAPGVTITVPAGTFSNPTGVEVRTAAPRTQYLYVTNFGAPAPATPNPAQTSSAAASTAILDTRCAGLGGTAVCAGGPAVGSLVAGTSGAQGSFRAAAKALNIGAGPGNLVYVTNRGPAANLVTIYTVPQNPTPGGALGAITPTTAVNLASNTPPGLQPYGVDFLEDLNRAFVGNFGSNSVTVINDNVLLNPAITQ